MDESCMIAACQQPQLQVNVANSSSVISSSSRYLLALQGSRGRLLKFATINTKSLSEAVTDTVPLQDQVRQGGRRTPSRRCQRTR